MHYIFGGPDTFLQGYVDSDMEGDKDNMRSTVLSPHNLWESSYDLDIICIW
jgi:hypothetical protein